MRIICESGATKGDWRAIDREGRSVGRVLSAGMNVSTMGAETVGSIIREAAAGLPEGPFDSVHFYTAGVLDPHVQAGLEALLGTCFPGAAVELQTDLVAAARAACGRRPGIVAILGTGSNSCQYDGWQIVRHVNAGGFILGDEGSASHLGKCFLSDFLKGLVPEPVASEFARTFPSDYATVVRQVYHNAGSPSAYLGGFAPFLLSHVAHPYIRSLVTDSLLAFIDRNLRQYETDRYPVSVVGGYGCAVRDILTGLFAQNGIRAGAFIPAPIEELVKYHGHA